LAGAQSLPLSGPGWETLRPARNRFWGNPALIAFLEDMTGKTQTLGTLLIGDLAQPRGGRMTSGHGSHQTGVDVDILYHVIDGPLSAEDRADPAQDSAVRPDDSLDPALWGGRQTALLKAFASDGRVERIFVNAAIKRTLCRSVTEDRAWLQKLRPWWGHDEHFHVRIKCPAGDTDCLPGPALPQGDGCGRELDWWFTDEAKHPVKTPGVKPPAPDKPAACRAILG
jgi:penicillin-insensitive murein endopeptidase